MRNANAGVYRFEPRTHKFETYIAYGFANPHGHVFDRWGQDIVVDGTGAQPYHAALFSGHMITRQARHAAAGLPAADPAVPRHRDPLEPALPRGVAGESARANVIGFQGILRYKIDDDGASFIGDRAGADRCRRAIRTSGPSDFEDRARTARIYFIDWHNPIIGHMQHNLRDPSRDRIHGRIYRVTYEGRPLSKTRRRSRASQSRTASNCSK